MAKKIVVDSSVIIKWLNQSHEQNIEQADKLLKDTHEGEVDLFSPELAKYEVGNVLLSGKKLTQSESKIPFSILFDLPIQYIQQTPELERESYAIASAFDVSYNEGVFLALTEQKDATYVTDIFNDKYKDLEIKIIALKDY